MRLIRQQDTLSIFQINDERGQIRFKHDRACGKKYNFRSYLKQQGYKISKHLLI